MDKQTADFVSDIRIFAVDDDAGALKSLDRLISSFALDVTTFSSGKELVSSLPVDGRCVVISDVRMFEISGLEILNRITDDHPEIPVILVSAYADVDLAVRAMRSGAVAVLRKPYSEEELWDGLRAAIQANEAALEKRAQRNYILDRILLLTDNELDVLQCITDGKQHKQCAAELGWSLRTIEKYRAEALGKLGMTSPYQLVKAFMEAGITEWPGSQDNKNDRSPA